MYTALLSPQPDPANGYTVSIPSLPGVVSEGDTRREALSNIVEAAGLWIRDALASGEPIPVDDPTAIAEAVQLAIEDRRAENWPIALELAPVDVSERSQVAA